MSRTRHDDLAKLFFELWLSPLGQVQLDARLAAQPRRADVLFTAGPDDPRWRRRLGLLGRLAHGLLVLELFRNVPTSDEIDSALAKRIELRAQQLRQVRALRTERAREAARHQLPSILVMVVTPHLPRAHRVLYGIDVQARGGLYALAPALGVLLVVVDELPRERDTIWLRLLGRGAVQRGAIGEVLAQVRREPLADATLRLVRQWQASLPPSVEQTDEERAEMKRYEELLAKADRREALLREQALREGEARGKAEGLRVTIADLCEVLGVKLGKTRQGQLRRLDLDELEALRMHLKQHHAWPA